MMDDARCQLRSALGLAPDLARKLHQIARKATGSSTAIVIP